MSASDGTTFSGITTGVDMRDSYQKLTTGQQISTKIAYAQFGKQAFFKAIGLEAFGVDAVNDVDIFGAAMFGGSKPTRMITFDSGHSMSGPVNATTGSSFHSTRQSSYSAEYVAGGDQWIYAWNRIDTARFIPEMDVLDNQSKKLQDIMAETFKEAQGSHVRDLALGILGASSAPDYGTLGPNAVKTDLPNLISVTQAQTVGNIAMAANPWWQNGVKEITDAGGGGEFDRPLLLRRGLMAIMNDTGEYAESAKRFLLLCNQGFWQTYDRLQYADLNRHQDVMVKSASYDAAGITHKMFNGSPMMWDTNATIPYGGTASTDFVTGIDVDTYAISLHTSCNFKLHGGWEGPRAHDQYRQHNLLISTRYNPYITSRRTHFCVHGVPANAD